MPLKKTSLACILGFIPIFSATNTWSAGLVRDGISARSAALGGSSIAVAESPLDAMTANPAALPQVKNGALEISVDGIFIRGRLERDDEKDSSLKNRVNFLGDIALVLPTGHRAVRFGLSASPTYAAAADWRYRDREGGLGGETSYGEFTHHSKFLAYNFQAGIGADLTSWLSAGLSAGVVYNQNELNSSYAFQTQRSLQGFKTRLDLNTEGYGATGQFGITIKPFPSLRLSLVYTTPSEIHSEGSAKADLSAQLKSLGISSDVINPRLEADAEVLTKLPQKISVGLAWQTTNQLLLTVEFNWIDWSSAFDQLPVTLSNSSNTGVNNLVGSDMFTDVIPLGWRDQKIIRFGAEYDIDNVWTVRIGAAYSTAVIPNQTITPLNAALAESVISAGVGYQQPGWHLDFSWQWHLPIREKTSRSDLLSGEYSDSSIELESHWLGLTYGLDF